MARTNRTKHGNTVCVLQPYSALGWRVIRQIDMDDAADRILAGTAREIFDKATGRLKGIELADGAPKDENIPSGDRTPCALSAREMRFAAGLYGESLTERMSEERRVGRVHPASGRMLPAEDEVERVREKLKLYPFPAPGRGDRAVRVYPRAPQAATAVGEVSR